jgi:uncharacterized protein (TIGR02996 family)
MSTYGMESGTTATGFVAVHASHEVRPMSHMDPVYTLLWEASPFIQAIIANPDDDTPRLVLADWLEERGYVDRAAFMRIQCRHGNLNKNDNRKERGQLRRLAPIAEGWINSFIGFHDFKWGSPSTAAKFVRGFIEECTFHSIRSYLDHIDLVASLVPLQTFHIHNPYGGREEFPQYKKDQFTRLAQSAYVESLVSLEMLGGDTAVDENEITIFAAAPLRKLRYLGLCTESDDSVRTVINAPALVPGVKITIEGHFRPKKIVDLTQIASKRGIELEFAEPIPF